MAPKSRFFKRNRHLAGVEYARSAIKSTAFFADSQMRYTVTASAASLYSAILSKFKY